MEVWRSTRLANDWYKRKYSQYVNSTIHNRCWALENQQRIRARGFFFATGTFFFFLAPSNGDAWQPFGYQTISKVNFRSLVEEMLNDSYQSDQSVITHQARKTTKKTLWYLERNRLQYLNRPRFGFLDRWILSALLYFTERCAFYWLVTIFYCVFAGFIS